MKDKDLPIDMRFSDLLQSSVYSNVSPNSDDILMHINTENLLLIAGVSSDISSLLESAKGTGHPDMKIISDDMFANNSFAPSRIPLIESGYEKLLIKIREDISLLEGFIKIFENNPDKGQIHNIRGYVIMKIEGITKRVLEMRGKNMQELSEDKAERWFLDNVLNCFNAEDSFLVISKLEKIKSIKYAEKSSVEKEHAKYKKSLNFRSGNYDISS